MADVSDRIDRIRKVRALVDMKEALQSYDELMNKYNAESLEIEAQYYRAKAELAEREKILTSSVLNVVWIGLRYAKPFSTPEQVLQTRHERIPEITNEIERILKEAKGGYRDDADTV